MSALAKVSLTDQEKRLGMRVHYASGPVTPLRLCRRCGDPLGKRNQSGIHEACQFIESMSDFGDERAPKSRPANQKFHMAHGRRGVRSTSPLRATEHKCSCQVRKIIPPKTFEINVIAIACIMCGHVFDYIDRLEPFERAVAEVRNERQQRPWVVRRGIAIEVPGLPAEEREIEQRLRQDQTYGEIAAAMDLPEPYIRAHAILSHLDPASRESKRNDKRGRWNRQGKKNGDHSAYPLNQFIQNAGVTA
jgi:hypothetical protein